MPFLGDQAVDRIVLLFNHHIFINNIQTRTQKITPYAKLKKREVLRFGTTFPVDGSCPETLIENIYNLKHTLFNTSDTVKWFVLSSFKKAKPPTS
ncbi:MAG: hypothetical protein CVU99_14680 [Firmicutes bacterium HGW-Firmicutes-4]|nr:MAG: hypothetical protein CVU99_14680 [Firmicutes bacterium HGW-Firmicutes-4]